MVRHNTSDRRIDILVACGAINWHDHHSAIPANCWRRIEAAQ